MGTLKVDNIQSSTDSSVNFPQGLSSSTQPLSIPNGSASSPSIRFDSDPDTGLYLSGTNQISVSTNGTERLRITNNGFLSIGDNITPTTQLHVAGSYNGNGPLLRLENTAVNNSSSAFGQGLLLRTGRTGDGDIFVGTHQSNSRFLVALGTTPFTELFTVLQNGNVGIGVTNPITPIDILCNASAFGISLRGRPSDNISVIRFLNNDSNTTYGIFDVRPDFFTINAVANVPLIFNTNNAERMRISSGGNLLVGINSDWTGNFAKITGYSNISSGRAISAWNNHNSSGSAFLSRVDYTVSQLMTFYYGGATVVGSITTNGTGTSYVTTSDYRLKENPVSIQNATQKIKNLNPVTYTWKSNGSISNGFLAHELQEHIPDAVRGTKDEVDQNGNPMYQGVDASYIIPFLVKAFQELDNRITTLEGT